MKYIIIFLLFPLFSFSQNDAECDSTYCSQLGSHERITFVGPGHESDFCIRCGCTVSLGPAVYLEGCFEPLDTLLPSDTLVFRSLSDYIVLEEAGDFVNIELRYETEQITKQCYIVHFNREIFEEDFEAVEGVESFHKESRYSIMVFIGRMFYAEEVINNFVKSSQ